MPNKKIVADAGPLIVFGRIKRLVLLAEIHGKIIAPRQVLKECLANPTLPGAREISEAVAAKLITPHDDPLIHEHQNLFDILGPGEATAIVLASQLKTALLIDEKLGRQTARKMNLPIIGTAGVLLLAKERKLVKKVAPILQELKSAGYYLSEDLIETVLRRAGEKN